MLISESIFGLIYTYIPLLKRASNKISDAQSTTEIGNATTLLHKH